MQIQKIYFRNIIARKSRINAVYQLHALGGIVSLECREKKGDCCFKNSNYKLTFRVLILLFTYFCKKKPTQMQSPAYKMFCNFNCLNFSTSDSHTRIMQFNLLFLFSFFFIVQWNYMYAMHTGPEYSVHSFHLSCTLFFLSFAVRISILIFHIISHFPPVPLLPFLSHVM